MRNFKIINHAGRGKSNMPESKVITPQQIDLASDGTVSTEKFLHAMYQHYKAIENAELDLELAEHISKSNNQQPADNDDIY